MKNRQMKVTRAYRAKKYRPQITLCGDWLESLGFLPGNTVEIERVGHALVVRRVWPPPKSYP